MQSNERILCWPLITTHKLRFLKNIINLFEAQSWELFPCSQSLLKTRPLGWFLIWAKQAVAYPARHTVARCYTRYGVRAEENRGTSSVDLLQTWCLSELMRTLVCFGAVTQSSGGSFEWMPRTKGVSLLRGDHVWLRFKTLTGPQAPSIHYEGIAASHLSQSAAERRGGCSACLAASPGSSIERKLWKQNRRCWRTSPWDVVELTFLFHNPENIWETLHSQRQIYPNMQASTHTGPGKKQTLSAHTHTGDWV